MGEALILGLTARDERCPVCDVSPQAWRPTSRSDVVECARCACLSQVYEDGGNRVPVPAAGPADLALLRAYWLDTGRRLGSREIADGDPEILARVDAMDDWCQAHPEIVARTTLAKSSPYRSLTAIAVEDPGGRGLAWSMMVPAEGVGSDLQIPFDPNLVHAGTILTIQTPIVLNLRPEESGPKLFQ